MNILKWLGRGKDDSYDSYKIKITAKEGTSFYFELSGSGVATVDWRDGSEKDTLTLNDGGVSFNHTYPKTTKRTIIINGDNITKLNCNFFFLTSLDVSHCNELSKLTYRTVTSLDLSNNTALTSLSVSDGNFTSLDLSKNTALTSLYISSNFASIDLSKNTALTSLHISGNFPSLDLSNNTALTKLHIGSLLTGSSEPLTSIDLSNNTALSDITVFGQFEGSELNKFFRTLHSDVGEKSIDISFTSGKAYCDRSIAESKGWKVVLVC